MESNHAETDTHDSFVARLGRWNVAARAATITGLYSVYLAATASLGWTIQGRTGLLAAAFATCVCLFACHLALVVTTLMVPPSRAAAHLLSGMMIRMSVPLLASLFVVEQQRDWISAGYGWFVVGAFLLGLTAETLFTVGHLQALTAKSPKSESGNGPPSSAAMSPLHPST